jgi:hypothetical protein
MKFAYISRNGWLPYVAGFVVANLAVAYSLVFALHRHHRMPLILQLAIVVPGLFIERAFVTKSKTVDPLIRIVGSGMIFGAIVAFVVFI